MKTLINDVTAELGNLEGGKSQAKQGDVKQIIAILSDKIVDDVSVLGALIQNGLKRKQKRTATKKRK